MKLNEVAGSIDAFKTAFPYSGLQNEVIGRLVDEVRVKSMGDLEVGGAALSVMRITALNRNANWRLSGTTAEEEARRAWDLFLSNTKCGPNQRFIFDVPSMIELPFRVQYDKDGNVLR